MLVYTPKGNISAVGNFLHGCGLLLDHPTDFQHPASYHYYNPHNPPPGGHNRSLLAANRIGYGSPGPQLGRWGTPTISGKSVEVHRSQVDELFKSLKGGEELAETEPSELFWYSTNILKLNLIQAHYLYPKIVFFVIEKLWKLPHHYILIKRKL
jgi:hypothetical protein